MHQPLLLREREPDVEDLSQNGYGKLTVFYYLFSSLFLFEDKCVPVVDSARVSPSVSSSSANGQVSQAPVHVVPGCRSCCVGQLLRNDESN